MLVSLFTCFETLMAVGLVNKVKTDLQSKQCNSLQQ